MAKKSDKPSKKQGKPRVHKDLSGLEISINQFGEIKSNMDIEKLNEFLDKNVEDKKLIEREETLKNKKRKKKK
ncbi:MAG TPA: hypothetical protein DIS90_15350, partial [Cytophagales bacterium]|nr:hypothetical protein [Cytophagales bacterium]